MLLEVYTNYKLQSCQYRDAKNATIFRQHRNLTVCLSVCEASRCPRMAGKNASKDAGCVGNPVSPRRNAPKTKNGATKMNYAKEAAQCVKYDLAYKFHARLMKIANVYVERST